MRRLRALIGGLPADAAVTRRALARPAPKDVTRPVAGPRRTSTPEQVRRAGGRFVHAPRGAAD